MSEVELKKDYLNLWKEIIGVEEIIEDEDFFDQGGTSLSLIQLIGETKKRFSVDLNITDFAEGLTMKIYIELLNKK
jgi:acyl carrier protein